MISSPSRSSIDQVHAPCLLVVLRSHRFIPPRSLAPHSAPSRRRRPRQEAGTQRRIHYALSLALALTTHAASLRGSSWSPARRAAARSFPPNGPPQSSPRRTRQGDSPPREVCSQTIQLCCDSFDGRTTCQAATQPGQTARKAPPRKAMPSLFASFRRRKSAARLRKPDGDTDLKQVTKNGDGPEGRHGSETPALPLTVRLSGFGLDAFDLEQLDADMSTFAPHSARPDETSRPSASSSRLPVALDGGARASPPSALQKRTIGPSGPSTWNLATARSGAAAGKGATGIAAGLPESPPAEKSAQIPHAPPSLPASQNGRHQPRTSSKPAGSLSGLAAPRSLQSSSSFYHPAPPPSIPRGREPDLRTGRNPGVTPSSAPLEATAVERPRATLELAALPRTDPASVRLRKSRFFRSADPSRSL